MGEKVTRDYHRFMIKKCQKFVEENIVRTLKKNLKRDQRETIESIVHTKD